MSFPPAAFFASVFQSDIPGSTLKITNFPLPSQSFFIGIPYIIIFPCAETPDNAADALYIYNRTLYDAINTVPGAIFLLSQYKLRRGCSQKIGLWGTDSTTGDSNFQKPDNTFKTISQSGYDTIKPILQKIDDDVTITPEEVNTLEQYINIKGVMMYTNHGYFQYGKQLYYFSTLDGGTTLYYSLAGVEAKPAQFIPAVGDEFITVPNPLYIPSVGDEYITIPNPFYPIGDEYITVPNPLYEPAIGPEYITVPNPSYVAAQNIPGVPGFPDIPSTEQYPDNAHKYNVYRYFTALKYGNVDLNVTPSFVLGWSSSDITGDYGADVASVSMYKENGPQQGITFDVTYDYTFDSTIELPGNIKAISTIPSGRYYYTYDFVTKKIAAIIAEGYSVYPDSSGNTSLQTTPVFTFITKFLQSITANNIAPGGTTTIIPNFGIGYPLNTYQITVNDSTDSTRRSALAPTPFQYTPPITVNTRTYRITVNGSSDSNDTGVHTADFIAYQYVVNLDVATRVIGSARNYVTWTGGSLSSQFQYNTTLITTDGSTDFTSGKPLDTAGLTAGVGYSIVPTNVNEKNGTYSTFYFDSITPNTLIIASANTQQQYTLTWGSYYNYNFPAPDGSRQYPVSVIGNGTTRTFTSLYNVVLLPYSSVTYGVPYTINVLDITIATNVFFYDPPTNITITPNYVNFPNIIQWSSATPTFNVIMNQLTFQGTPPTEQNLTQDTSGVSGNILFWPVGSTSSNAIICDTYDLSANTLFLSLGATVPIFQGIVLPFDFGEYLYPTDHFSLSLYRNGVVVKQLEASITIPFTWNPYTYVVTYQPNDQLYFKSIEHLNYGISDPFTFTANATVSVDKAVYNLDSTILVTMIISVEMPTFYVKLKDVAGIYPPFQVDFVRNGSQYSFNLNDISLNINLYRLDFYLSNSPTISISTQSFQVTTPVTIEAYSIYSTVKATLYVDLPTTFTVQLKNGSTTIDLPDFDANLLSHYSFNPFTYVLTNTSYYLRFYPAGLNIIVDSPPFTLVQTATISVSEQYSIYETIKATVDLGGDETYANFTVELQDDANENDPLPLPSIEIFSSGEYSFKPSDYPDYELTNTDYYLIFKPAGLNITLYSPTFTLVQTATISLSKNQYSIYETIKATVDLGGDEGDETSAKFTVELQDFANITPRITLDPFEVGSSGEYSFTPSDYGLTDNTYYLIFKPANLVITLYSTPFTLIQTATISVSEQYSIYGTITATVDLGGDETYANFTVQLQDAANENVPIPLDPFEVFSSGEYSFKWSDYPDYELTDTNYYLIFKPDGLVITLDSEPFTLVQTATLTLDQSNYTIISNIIATFDLHLHADPSIVFSIELQDAANENTIPLPSLTVDSLRYYSFLPYDSNLSDTGYYFIARPAGINIVLQSAVFQMSTNYFTLLPISTPLPEFSRATTNTLCVTAKKNNVATTIISVVNNIAYASAITGKPQFLVPCGIVKYLKELNKLLITMGLRDALLLLIQKYDIPQSTPAVTNQTRYKYPTVIAKVLKPILQYSSTFRLSIKTTGHSVYSGFEFVEILKDARVLTICNDDTKTFSTLYTDMLVKAPYWLNTLQPFKKDGDFTYCVVRPIQGSLKQLITASIMLKNNYLIFTPVVLRLVLGFYNAYGPVDLDIMFSSNSIVEILNYLKAAYEKIYLNPVTAL